MTFDKSSPVINVNHRLYFLSYKMLNVFLITYDEGAACE